MSAQEAEVNTIEILVDIRQLKRRPRRFLYDKAAHADWLRDALESRGIEQVTPHQRSRKKALTYMQNERGSGLLRWLLELQPKSRGKKRKAIAALIHYVQPRQDRMDYPTCREKGW